MIVIGNGHAVVAEKISWWGVWSYPDWPTKEKPEAELMACLDGGSHSVDLWAGNPLIVGELLRSMPTLVDRRLREGGYAEVDLDEEIGKLLAGRGLDVGTAPSGGVQS